MRCNLNNNKIVLVVTQKEKWTIKMIISYLKCNDIYFFSTINYDDIILHVMKINSYNIFKSIIF